MKTPSASGRGDKTITDYADEWLSHLEQSRTA